MLPNDGRPLALGCMRLSTNPKRDEEQGLAVILAALDAGVRLLDTADAYAWDETEIGHNERLIARALASWSGDVGSVTVATKGGLKRTRGEWIADGRAKHLKAACEASLKALGVDQIDLYQLHAPDPRTKFATSIRALASLEKVGLIRSVGLCNVTVSQIRDALEIVEIRSVQVELNPWKPDNFRNGVAEFCTNRGIELIAHTPLGSPKGKGRLERDKVLRNVAARHRLSNADIVLAWLRGLSDEIIPIPGAQRLETARSMARLDGVELNERDWSELDDRFPIGRLLRIPRIERRPPDESPGDVVLLMGCPASGKTTLVQDYIERGYLRLNRDTQAKRLAELVPKLDEALGSGQEKVVLDNTYPERKTRNEIVETAWKYSVPVSCVWLATSIEDAQVNAIQRMLSRYGKLLSPEEIKEASKEDPNAFAPNAQFGYQRRLEPPSLDEGFKSIETVEFERRPTRGADQKALILDYDGIIRTNRSGRRFPIDVQDIELLPMRKETLRRYQGEGWLLLAVSWQPTVGRDASSAELIAAGLSRTHELLGVEIDAATCPHGDGPPICWCRKPLPGLGVAFIQQKNIDTAQSLVVGKLASDETFARRLGVPYVDHEAFFSES